MTIKLKNTQENHVVFFFILLSLSISLCLYTPLTIKKCFRFYLQEEDDFVSRAGKNNKHYKLRKYKHWAKRIL